MNIFYLEEYKIETAPLDYEGLFFYLSRYKFIYILPSSSSPFLLLSGLLNTTEEWKGRKKSRNCWFTSLFIKPLKERMRARGWTRFCIFCILLLPRIGSLVSQEWELYLVHIQWKPKKLHNELFKKRKKLLTLSNLKSKTF